MQSEARQGSSRNSGHNSRSSFSPRHMPQEPSDPSLIRATSSTRRRRNDSRNSDSTNSSRKGSAKHRDSHPQGSHAASSHAVGGSSHTASLSSHGAGGNSHAAGGSSHGATLSSHGAGIGSHALSSHGAGGSSHGAGGSSHTLSSHTVGGSSHGAGASSHSAGISSHALSSHAAGGSSHGASGSSHAALEVRASLPASISRSYFEPQRPHHSLDAIREPRPREDPKKERIRSLWGKASKKQEDNRNAKKLWEQVLDPLLQQRSTSLERQLSYLSSQQSDVAAFMTQQRQQLMNTAQHSQSTTECDCGQDNCPFCNLMLNMKLNDPTTNLMNL